MTAFLVAHWRMTAALAITVVLALYIEGLRIERDHYRDQRDKLQADLNMVKAIGEQAKKEAAAKAAEQEKNTKEVKDAYESDLADIDAYYAAHPSERVRVVYSRSGTVPAAPDCPARADGPASQPATPRGDPDFEKACALDAARVNAWRDFARKNGFPVR